MATDPHESGHVGLAKMNELRVADGNLRTSAVTGWRVDSSVIPTIDDVCMMLESPSTVRNASRFQQNLLTRSAVNQSII